MTAESRKTARASAKSIGLGSNRGESGEEDDDERESQHCVLLVGVVGELNFDVPTNGVDLVRGNVVVCGGDARRGVVAKDPSRDASISRDHKPALSWAHVANNFFYCLLDKAHVVFRC